MPLHPDFPERVEGDRWNQPDPIADIIYALDAAASSGLTLGDLAEVTEYDISSHGLKWSPGSDAIGSELQMTLLGRLQDGRWFSLDAWNDYTGWGCQDRCDIYIGDTREDVIANGLTAEGRNALGVTL